RAADIITHEELHNQRCYKLCCSQMKRMMMMMMMEGAEVLDPPGPDSLMGLIYELNLSDPKRAETSQTDELLLGLM
ncbi:Hypothetical predicted protein, partial [Scomber scombrus]